MQRTSLIDSIVAEIQQRILSGELKTGSSLGSQDELALSLGVSRPSLREALNRLSQMGLIEVKHGAGTFVRGLKPADFMSSLSPLLIMDQASAKELLDARLCIEPTVAEMAARSASKEDIARLESLLTRMESDVNGMEFNNYIDNNLQFHLSVAQISGNRVLHAALKIIMDLDRHFMLKFFKLLPSTISMWGPYHASIVNSIKTHDADRARREMKAHVEELARKINEAYDW